MFNMARFEETTTMSSGTGNALSVRRAATRSGTAGTSGTTRTASRARGRRANVDESRARRRAPEAGDRVHQGPHRAVAVGRGRPRRTPVGLLQARPDDGARLVDRGTRPSRRRGSASSRTTRCCRSRSTGSSRCGAGGSRPAARSSSSLIATVAAAATFGVTRYRAPAEVGSSSPPRSAWRRLAADPANGSGRGERVTVDAAPRDTAPSTTTSSATARSQRSADPRAGRSSSASP